MARLDIGNLAQAKSQLLKRVKRLKKLKRGAWKSLVSGLKSRIHSKFSGRDTVMQNRSVIFA